MIICKTPSSLVDLIETIANFKDLKEIERTFEKDEVTEF
jgi:hypothetical protein